MSTQTTGGPKRIRKRRVRPGQEFETISISIPKPQADHMRTVAQTTGEPVSEQITELVAAATGVGKDYLTDN